MPEAFADLLKQFAAMPLADRRAIEQRLSGTERAVLRNRLHPKKPGPTHALAEQKFNFESFSPCVAKRLAEILILGKAPAYTTDAAKAALSQLVPCTITTGGVA